MQYKHIPHRSRQVQFFANLFLILFTTALVIGVNFFAPVGTERSTCSNIANNFCNRLMLLEIPPKIAVSSFVGYLKGKSSLMIYEQFPNLKYKYRNREFWCRGYYVDTVGKNAKKIEEYIRNQLEEDRMGEQLTMGNF